MSCGYTLYAWRPFSSTSNKRISLKRGSNTFATLRLCRSTSWLVPCAHTPGCWATMNESALMKAAAVSCELIVISVDFFMLNSCFMTSYQFTMSTFSWRTLALSSQKIYTRTETRRNPSLGLFLFTCWLTEQFDVVVDLFSRCLLQYLEKKTVISRWARDCRQSCHD